jgi:hypothetical protein
MKRYIGYFDYLGYKEFILKNETDYVRRRVEHILRDIEMSLGKELKQMPNNPGVLIANLQTASVNCLNISDTVIFYTDDDSENSFIELVETANEFNWRNNLYHFPVRGIITLEEFEIITDDYVNDQGVIYKPNIMYGKGLVLSHIKCDLQEWAGCCIDNAVIDANIGKATMQIIDEKAIKYVVPLKKSNFGRFSEYALRLYTGGANATYLENKTKDIIGIFHSDHKEVDYRVQSKIDNTVAFLDFLKDK